MVNPENLKHKTFLGLLWMFAGTSGQQLANLAVMLVLARNLSPAAFGLVGLAMVIIDVLTIVGQAGLTEVIIQKENPSQRDLSTGFWTSLCFGVFLAAAAVLGAPWVARVFSEPELVPIMRFLAISCIFNTLGTVHEALLRRSFGFKGLAIRNMSAAIVSGIVAILLALHGVGAQSLVAQRVISTAWLMSALWISVRWIPSFEFSLRSCLNQLRMGASIVGTTLLGAGNQRIVDLLVGFFLGTTALGYLRIASKGLDIMLNLSVMPIQRVILTSMSKIQSDKESIARTYRRIVQASSIFIFPVFLGTAAVTPELIPLVFGPNWNDSIILMQLYTMMAFFVPLIYYRNNTLYAIGQADKVFVLGAISFAVSVVVYTITVQIGIKATAFGSVVQMALVTPVTMSVLEKYTGVRSSDIMRDIVPPAVASSVMVGILFLLRYCGFVPSYPIFAIGFLASIGAFIYIVILYTFFRKACVETIGILPQPFRKKMASLLRRQEGHTIKHDKRILAISSSGGHWTQMLRLRPAFEKHEVVYATTDKGSRDDVPNNRFYVVPNATRWNKLRLISLFVRIVYIVCKERPDVIISTGAAPGYFALFIGRLVGSRTIWLESIANAEKFSLSTKLAKPFSDLWLTQWPHMAGPNGPFYKGSVF